jgi:hypothetical protein
MSGYLHYSNHLLLTSNNRLNECCCDDGGLFWEAVPCDMSLDYKTALCADWDQDQLKNRIYINSDSRCNGIANNICECQQLRITTSGLTTSRITNFMSFSYGGSNFPSELTIDDTTLTITEPSVGSSGLNLVGKTTSQIQYFVNNFPSSNWLVTNSFGYDGENAATLVSTGILTFNSATTRTLGSRNSRINFSFSGSITPYANYDTNPATFATNLQNALVSGVGTGIVVQHNTYFGNVSNLFVFDITFGGNLCGIKQPFIVPYVHSLVPSATSNASFSSGKYGVYDTGETFLGTHTNYKVRGTGNKCPYEDLDWPGGPAFFDSSLQCCPQRGARLGPNATIGWESLGPSIVSGYAYTSPGTPVPNIPWANLDRVFVLGQSCYSLSPDYFLFGQEGRLEYDYHTDRKLYAMPDCNFGSGNTCYNSGVPCSCITELFIPQFHQNVPWGPFGSYYNGIESDVHKAYEFPFNDALNPAGGTSWLYLNRPGNYSAERIGFDYKPQGTIKTKGTWLETKEIEINFCVRRPVPFYVGTAAFDDLPFYIEIEPSTVTPFTSGYYGPLGTGCDCFTVIYNCSGKTVGDFLNAVNGLTVKNYGCNIFAFVAGSTDARSVPASKIINVSSELFEQVIGGYLTLSDGPIADSGLWSGADIIVGPKPYNSLFKSSPDNPDAPFIDVYTDNPSTTIAAHSPPICRIFDSKLPHVEPYGTNYYSRNNNMWFTAIQGCLKNVVNITKDPNIPLNYSYFDLNVNNKLFTYIASGIINGTGLLSTGFINTDKSGSGYTLTQFIADVTGVQFTNPLNSSTFNPFIATTGSDLFHEIWLDDQTSINGGTYEYSTVAPTRFNYSYKEPLVNFDRPLSLLNGSIDLQSFVRRRCNWTTDDVTFNDPKLNFCVPAASRTLGADALLNCGGEKVVDNGWLISYGCSSFVCKTTWYYACQRCPCSTVYRCKDGNGSNYPHPFNQAGNSLLNNRYWQDFYTSAADFVVNQPILYICESNLHPDCDIPMLVKVPFMIVDINNPTSGPLFQYGQNDALPGYSEFCDSDDPIYSNQYGWCQYLDPDSAKIKEEDIPRTRPVSSYIAQRGLGVFCSTHPWNFRPEDIQGGTIANILEIPGGSAYFGLPGGCRTAPDGVDCSLIRYNSCPRCENWDRIENLGLVYPEYYDYLPTGVTLTALFRPVISPLRASGVCSNGSVCSRIDIDCGTACCECGFAYEETGGTCCLSAKVHHPFTQTSTYSLTEAADSTRQKCAADTSLNGTLYDFYNVGGQCTFPPGVCDGVSCCDSFGACWNGSNSHSLSINLTRVITTCGCTINGGTNVCFTENNSISTSCAGTFCTSGVWIDPSQPSNLTYCFSCQDFPSPLNVPTGTFALGGCNFGCDGDGSTCSPRGINYVENCGGQGTYTYTKTLNSCGYGTTSYVESRVSSGNASPNVCSPSPYNWTGTCSLTVLTDDAKPVWGDCPTSVPTNGKTYIYIKNWENNVATFDCGYPQVGYASGVGATDSRFLGSTGCT